jgi:hypothetical protein
MYLNSSISSGAGMEGRGLGSMPGTKAGSRGIIQGLEGTQEDRGIGIGIMHLIGTCRIMTGLIR